MDHKVDHSVESNVDCLFCKIIAGQIPSKLVYQDDRIYAFADIRAQAPTHLLVLPRKHIRSLAEIDGDDESLLGHLLAVSAEIARKAGLENGYRVVINTGDDGGQTVDHLHLHVLGGRSMHWPPG
jgi:histidine triad (HIT) family protein